MSVAGRDADDDDVRAGPDGGGVAAEIGAECECPPQGLGLPAPVAGLTRSWTRGVMVATYGMLSTMPDSSAEPQSRTLAASRYWSPTASVTGLPSVSMTPTSTRAPTMTNSPMKNTRVGHSTSSRYSVGSSFESADERAGAEQGDQRRLDVERGVGDEPDHDGGETTPDSDQQSPVADDFALVQRHECGDAVGVVVERGAEQDPAQAEEHDHEHDDDRAPG